MKGIVLFLFLLSSSALIAQQTTALIAPQTTALIAQQTTIERVDPPFWWTGFKNHAVQLMIYGKNIGQTKVSLAERKQQTIEITAVNTVESPNYLFVDLKLGAGTQPGFFTLNFTLNNKLTASWKYELKARKPGSAQRKGFDNSDVIYLIMPDRFALSLIHI